MNIADLQKEYRAEVKEYYVFDLLLLPLQF